MGELGAMEKVPGSPNTLRRGPPSPRSEAEAQKGSFKLLLAGPRFVSITATASPADRLRIRCIR